MHRQKTLGILILVALAIVTCSSVHSSESQQPIYELKDYGGGHLLTHFNSKPSKITLPRICNNPLVFELGRENKHLKEIQAQTTKSSITFLAKPLTNYEIIEASDFINNVIRSLCAQDPSGLSYKKKLEILRQKISEVSAELESGFDESLAYNKRLLTEAYCALLPIKFNIKMDYPSETNADYKIFAGRKFGVKCTIHNFGRENIIKPNVRLSVPDEWTCELDASPSLIANLSPGKSAEFTYNIKAPRNSLYRPRVFPIIGELSFEHNGAQIKLNYPFEVQLVDPFTARQKIVKATPEKVLAKIELENAFPKQRMENVTISPFLPVNLSLNQEKKTISFYQKASFYVTYIRPKGDELRQRSTWISISVDEHPVRLRTVAEVVLPLGTTSEARGLWMNKCDDGLSEPKIIGETPCRQTMPNPLSPTRYLYFGVSDNMPVSGKTYIIVDYYDGTQGSFSLQYDSTANTEPFNGAYKDAGKTVRLMGSGIWKRETFVLEDAMFAGRQNCNSDFRLVVHDGDLAVKQIAVSKFPVTTD
ncbi:MAG: NEW3 domain-containing protein [Armatimonadota bacterium]|nr:NEW3 domain-containing protein [Armatimonadota bacterium]